MTITSNGGRFLMYECTFINKFGKFEGLLTLSSFSEIEQKLYDFLMRSLGKRGKYKIFKQISSPDQFRIILEKSFLAQELGETESFIWIILNVCCPVSFESYKPRQITKIGNVRFFLDISEKGILIGTVIIDCLRQDFQDLVQIIKEERSSKE